MRKVTKKDLLVCFLALLITGLACAWIFLSRTDAEVVSVYQNSNLTATYSLHKNRVVTVCEDDAHLVFEIKDGFVNVLESHCNGQDCVHAHPISMGGQTILCAPQRILLSISDSQTPDAVLR